MTIVIEYRQLESESIMMQVLRSTYFFYNPGVLTHARIKFLPCTCPISICTYLIWQAGIFAILEIVAATLILAPYI